MVADIELGTLDASEIPARRLSAEDVTSTEGELFTFPVAGTAKLLGRDHEIRESTLRQYDVVRSEHISRRSSKKLG